MWLIKAHTSQEAPTSTSGSSSPNQGDNLEKEREIDHWLYFSSEENINIAIKKVEELGYKILSSKKLDDEKNYPYHLIFLEWIVLYIVMLIKLYGNL